MFFKPNKKRSSTLVVEHTKVVAIDGRIYIPNSLQKRIIEWYHYHLCHPGASRLSNTVSQTMYWPGLSTDCTRHTRVCKMCQMFKKQKNKYGKLPPKRVEDKPWDLLCIDLIGPYTVTLEGNKTTRLQAMTFIDPATGWFEIEQVHNRTSAHMSHLLDLIWISLYLQLSQIITKASKIPKRQRCTDSAATHADW